MSISTFRAKRGLSLEACAAELGLRSRGHLSDIEHRRVRTGLRLALQIEARSGGEVRALDLVADEDAQLLRGAIDNAARVEAAA